MSFQQHNPTVARKPTDRMKTHVNRTKKANNDSVKSSVISLTHDDTDTTDDKEQSNISFLTPAAIKWMNKRKPKASNSNSDKQHINPSRVVQLKAIFRGLDFDNSGEISLQELKEAVAFVSSSDTNDGTPPIFEDPSKVNQFFDAMDIDGSGTVDFNEFLIAMTANTGDDNNNTKLQNAFYEFANQHRRKMIVSAIEDTTVPDLIRLEEAKKLFSIKFFKEDKESLDVNDQIKKAMLDAKTEQREIYADSYKIRHTELQRARAAGLYFKCISSNKKKSDTYTQALTSKVDKLDAEVLLMKSNKTLVHKLKQFPMNKGEGFMPHRAANNHTINQMARMDCMLVKAGGCKENVVILPPPISIRQRLDDARRSVVKSA